MRLSATYNPYVAKGGNCTRCVHSFAPPRAGLFYVCASSIHLPMCLLGSLYETHIPMGCVPPASRSIAGDHLVPLRVREAGVHSHPHIPRLPTSPQLAITIMLKLPLHYEDDKLLDGDGRELTRAEIIRHLSVLNSVALAAELLEMYCPRPAIPRAVREDIDIAMAALRLLK